MKKIIRLIIAILCVFLIIRAWQSGSVPFLHSIGERIAEYASDAALTLAGKIDDLTGGKPDGAEAADQKGHEDAGSDPSTSSDPVSEADRDPSEGVQGEKSGASADGQDDSDSGSQEVSGHPEEEDTDTTGETGTGTIAEADTDIAGTDIVIEEDPVSSSSSDAGSYSSSSLEDDTFYYYYSKISSEERLLYNAMLALCMNTRSGEYPEESCLISLNPSGDEFAQSYTRAYNALVTDHPELFWVAQGRSHFECRYYVLPSLGGKFTVVLSIPDPYDNHFQEQEELKNAADALLENVDFSLSDPQIALQIHDLLIDSAWYNTQAGEDDYAHTAYGALVRDSSGNPGGALCDGYSMAYEYLLQKAGIPCTMVCGYAGESDQNNEKHAWNLICLDDEWYEVDATWDDLDFYLSPDDEGYDLLTEALSDDGYMDRIRHSMWCLTTQQIRYFTPGDEYRYVSDSGWVTLLQPSVHIRFSINESEQTRDYVTPLAPVAEGTRYSWETVSY